MKTYFDLLAEITPEYLYQGLLAHGLFIDKLPPIFTSNGFFYYCRENEINIIKKFSTYIYYESMRETNIPRQYGIPNPFLYKKLCACLRDNWENLLKYFNVQTKNNNHKISRLHIRKLKYSPAVFEMNYKNWKIDGSPEPDLMIGKKYIVHADIATCFPSIYTHSIPWALAGKDVAKNNRDTNKWFNKIDFCTRNLKDQETHGLLIGPHASNLLSEIILVNIDNKLSTQGWHNFTRVIDDYTCYVSTFEEGQKFISKLSENLRAYDLLLNYRKTSISELPYASAEQWVRQLNALVGRTRNEILNYKDVEAYWDNVIEIMHRNEKKSSVINYALKILDKENLSRNAQEYCVKTILHYAYIYPYLVRLLDEYIFEKYLIEKDIIESFSNKIYADAKKHNNFEEMLYALFFSIKYDFKIVDFSCDDIIQKNDCLLLTAAYLYCLKKKEAVNILHDYAIKLSNNDTDFGRSWLYIYEVLPKEKLKDEWKRMKTDGITFIKDLSAW
jgi:hypothetical protein